MSETQKSILLLGLLAVIGLSLYPPFQVEHAKYLISYEGGVPHKTTLSLENVGHHWIWSPPQRAAEENRREIKSHVASVDWPRLGVYVGLTAFAALLASLVVFKGKPDLSKT